MKEKLQRYSTFPRGKKLFAPFAAVLRLMARDLAVVLLFFLAVISMMISEDVMAFNSKLLGVCLSLNALQIILSIVFFKQVRNWKRWIVLIFAVAMLGDTFAMLHRLL